MTRIATTGLRRCLRIQRLGSCTTGKGTQSQRCLASSICPAHTSSSSSNGPRSPTSILRTSPVISRTVRTYSTAESTVQGTIGKGPEGVADEAHRIQESLEAPDHLDDKERQIWDMLMKDLECTELEVKDISGGCGSMYGLEIVSEKFRGLNMLKQQRLVNEVLGDEIKKWHGVQLKTRAP